MSKVCKPRLVTPRNQTPIFKRCGVRLWISKNGYTKDIMCSKEIGLHVEKNPVIIMRSIVNIMGAPV